MSRSGKLALEKIVFEYSAAGDGAAVRQALAREIPLFKQKYPAVRIELRPRKSNVTPALTGFYHDGSERAWDLTHHSAQAVWIRMHKLVNDTNTAPFFFNNESLHRSRRSVQGHWSPWLWLAERHVERTPAPRWDRALSEPEWDHYVEHYSQRMEKDELAIQARVDQRNAAFAPHTAEVQQRWAEHVAPTLQTDVEHNVAHFKKQGARNKFPKPVAMGEYQLFATPDHTTMGQDAITALRRHEQRNLEEWWAARKAQTKPPA